jgi:hypothetical protein
MTRRRISVWTGAALLVGGLAQAQDAYIFATYYRCTEAKEKRADELFTQTAAPLLEKQVKAGRLTTFGWSRHWFGGAWRRLEYAVGSNLDQMIDARNEYIKDFTQNPAAAEEFGTICSSHDDYLWRRVASSMAPSALAKDRPPVAMTTYFQCESNEEEADEIVKAAYAPVLNQHVKEGKIASWSWLEHLMGGSVRRALVVDGASHKAMLGYWATLAKTLEASAPEPSKKFGSICHSHSDYVWDLK